MLRMTVQMSIIKSMDTIISILTSLNFLHLNTCYGINMQMCDIIIHDLNFINSLRICAKCQG